MHFLFIAAIIFGCSSTQVRQLNGDNPISEIAPSPLGISALSDLAAPPTPERVRLGRWLFFDKRLSKDGTVSCATCHRPENAFSEPTATSTGIGGQVGGRKAPSFVNQAWTLFPHFFWDGREASLEGQALGPVQNPIEMGNTIENMLTTLKATTYADYFAESFGDREITAERVAKAIADYERTRRSGNSKWDQWQAGDETAVSAEVKLGHSLFQDKGKCNQCHLGQNFTDSLFHNLGVGWNAKSKKFADIGRFEISKKKEDRGAFKTPGLRDLGKRGPYMHDGSHKTLLEVVEYYNRGGEKNPQLSPKIQALTLTNKEVLALVAFLGSLEGEGYMDSEPKFFP